MPREFEPRELEPLDVEPVDLEPIDLEPAEDAARFDRSGDRRPVWPWFALAGAALVAWAAIALTNRSTHARPAAAPTPTSHPTGQPTNQRTNEPTTVPPVDRITYVKPILLAELRTVGSGRFAAIVDDRLYVIDATRPSMTPVPLPGAHATIDDQNGPSLLVSTFEQTLVSTQPIATHTLSARDYAIKADASAQWWLLRDDGTVRGDHDDGAGKPVPEGLRPVATIADGFLALDTHSFWVVWSQSGTRPVGQLGDQLLATHAHTIAFRSECVYSGCALHLLDLAHGTLTLAQLSQIPEFAEFSPDGTRLAVATTTGGVFVVNTKTGEIVTGTRAVTSSSPSRPFTWTPDSRELLVVQDHAVEIRRASDGLVTKTVSGTDGLEQLVALP